MANHLVNEQDIRIEYVTLDPSILVERDVKATMRDGCRLSVNVFRPDAEGTYPVVMAVSPYGKDQYGQNELFRNVPACHLGEIKISDHTAFEAPDPNYWVKRGYVVVQGDVRGQGQSEGDTGPFHQGDRQDYYDLIEWAAVQPWSNGNVGLNGVSYLCISQWGVAAMKPPHLKALVLWEGWNDYYNRFHKGGIPETTFMGWLWNFWVLGAHNPASGFVEPDYLANAAAHPLNDEYWRQFDTDLSKIEAPALVCASFSDQGLHTPDTFEGFMGIASKDKWLFSHRRPKWSAYYAQEALELQTRFLDHYLKGEGDGLEQTPRVTFEVNRSRTDYKTITRSSWPPEDAELVDFHLDVASKTLSRTLPSEASVSYDSIGSSGLVFDIKIDHSIVVAGYAKLRLWVSADQADDIDLFVGLEKLDADGDRVLFYGFGGTNPNDVISRGWLRVSHREADDARSTPWRPVHKHQRLLTLERDEIVAVDIALCPSATAFEPGETLRLVVQGTPIQPDAGLLGYASLVNRGVTTLHTGGDHNSHLLLPLIQKV